MLGCYQHECNVLIGYLRCQSLCMLGVLEEAEKTLAAANIDDNTDNEAEINVQDLLG